MNRFALASLLLIGPGIVFSDAGMRFAVAADKHEHKEGDKDHKDDDHGGPKTDLGTQKIAGLDVQVTLVGAITPGKEAIFVITPKGEGKPKSVKAWVGVESGKGSIKTAAEEEKGGEWHAHHDVSKPLPADSKLWVEVEAGGSKAKGSFAVKL